MEIKKHISLVVVVYVLGVLASLKFGCGGITGGNWNRSCIESEKQALVFFKESLVDHSNYLSSWVGDDCCAWRGISCNNKTGHVVQLDLRESLLSGLVPHHLGNLSRLQYLDLSYNSLSIDSMGWLFKLALLEHLDLSYVDLSGTTDWFPAFNTLPNSLSVLNLFHCQLPNNHLSFMNLTSLVSLELGYNYFNSFPLWVFNNTGLQHLNLESNDLIGPFPESIGRLTSLSTLDLSNNKFSDSIPHEMGNVTELTGLTIASNEFRGSLPEEFCQLSMLETLDISYNQLSGSIPECIGELSNLEFLYLRSNSWEGFVSEHHFFNLTSLVLLSISSNSNLVMNVSSEWVPPFQLIFIHIESLKVGPKFPQWLLTQTQTMFIWMLNTSISDVIPVDWFVSVLLSQATSVDLSDNYINVEQLSFISVASSDLRTLALSNNSFSTEFPACICNLTSLTSLVLSYNNFSGELPQCLENLTELSNLDVMNNSLSGDIPVSLGSLTGLTYLNLHNNNFQGKLPLSFQNLTKLIALDVGKNNLTDIIPPWIGEQLHHLKYLILRYNNFYGNIPTQLCNHSSIQILNLARNQITGSIPPCFGNFSAMITGNNTDLDPGFPSYYGETIIVDAKGYEQKYTSTLGFMYSIDLSVNKIGGGIPGELMDLHGLFNLNLAGNHLVGRIPNTIGKLENLEVLDLSRNELYGPIPQSLSDLNFLNRLNLSFNDLSGRIPTGNQLQTLDDASIYAGNNQLCGRPILKPCAGDAESHNVHDHKEADSDSDSDDDHLWFYAGIGPGMLVGFLGFCGSLHFIKSRRYACFHSLEQAFDKIVVVIVVEAAQLRRKFHT